MSRKRRRPQFQRRNQRFDRRKLPLQCWKLRFLRSRMQAMSSAFWIQLHLTRSITSNRSTWLLWRLFSSRKMLVAGCFMSRSSHMPLWCASMPWRRRQIVHSKWRRMLYRACMQRVLPVVLLGKWNLSSVPWFFHINYNSCCLGCFYLHRGNSDFHFWVAFIHTFNQILHSDDEFFSKSDVS